MDSSFSSISNSDDDNKMDISFSSSMSTSDHLEIEIDFASSSINDLKFDKLNIDIFHFYLFNYLHIKDIINLRSVSKIFRSIVDSYEIKQLAFINGFYDPICDSDGEEVKTENYLASSGKLRCLLPFSKFNKVAESPNLLNIKDLSVYGGLCSNELEYVNKFIKLQKLKLDWFYMYYTDDISMSDDDVFENLSDLSDLSDLSPLDSDASFDTRADWYEERERIRWQKKWDLRKHRLHLPDLKELYIEIFDENELCFDLVIDAPNLLKLKMISSTNSNLNIEIIHPFSIEYLMTFDYYENVSAFSNLECLELHIRSVDEIKMLKEVPKLKNLKKLLINYISSYYMQQTIDGLKDLFVSKKDDLDIVLFGVKIKNTNKLNECKDKEELVFQLDNYAYLEDNLPLQEFNYIKLMNLIPKIPNDFFKKYSNIKIIKINGQIDDESRLIFFIKRCKKLYQLDIIDAWLSQQFYDQLPEICSLTCLKIEDYKITTEFAEKMPHLFGREFCIFGDSDDSDDQDHQMNENA